MCILKCLKLEKIIQVSFGEYHRKRKRNYVERVHAEENRVLSKHRPFKSNCVHPNATTGSQVKLYSVLIGCLLEENHCFATGP